MRVRANSNLLLMWARESVNISEQPADDGFWAGKRNCYDGYVVCPRGLGLRKSGAQSRGVLGISWLPNENQSSLKAAS